MSGQDEGRQFFLPAKASGRPKDSVAVPLGVELIDRSLNGDRSGSLPHVLVDDT